MEIVPVLDLKGGIVVHARRGRRSEYAPLRSPLVDSAEPVAVARALTAACATRRLYVADLDALAGAPVDESTLAALSVVAEPWVDAGATTPAAAAALHRAGVARSVIGTESLDPHAVPPSPNDAPQPPRALSIDLRNGVLISPDPSLAGRPPEAAAPLAAALNAHELLVIDLARVGSGEGPALDAVAALAAALPDTPVYAGGGVRDDADLRALQDAGAAGALVATALHSGAVTPRRVG